MYGRVNVYTVPQATEVRGFVFPWLITHSVIPSANIQYGCWFLFEGYKTNAQSHFYCQDMKRAQNSNSVGWLDVKDWWATIGKTTKIKCRQGNSLSELQGEGSSQIYFYLSQVQVFEVGSETVQVFCTWNDRDLVELTQCNSPKTVHSSSVWLQILHSQPLHSWWQKPGLCFPCLVPLVQY